jgi:GT2 family glycosyltransferase
MKTSSTRLQETSPRISVVVPTFRRAALLRRCLDALIAQRIDPDAFEIIVVDEGHEDCVRELVLRIAQWIRAPQIRYMRPAHARGLAAARNRGWRVAKGALIAFTDDDTIPAPDWLEAGARAFENNRQWIALSGDVPMPLEIESDTPTDRERMTAGVEPAEFVTANAFVWRAALQAIDGFDERFTRALRADSDLQFRLLTQVGQVGHCAEARVVHPVPDEPWGVCLREQRKTYFDALLYKKHPRLYRERIRRMPPWDYYLIVALVVIAPVLLIAGMDESAVGCALAVLAIVGRLAWKRLRSTDYSPRRLLEMLATSAVIPFLSVYWRVRGALRFKVLFL